MYTDLSLLRGFIQVFISQRPRDYNKFDGFGAWNVCQKSEGQGICPGNQPFLQLSSSETRGDYVNNLTPKPARPYFFAR